MTMLRTNFPDWTLEDALPFLEKIIEETYEGYPSVAEKIFNVGDLPNGITQHSESSALSPLVEIGEGAEVPQDRTYQGFATTYKSTKYGSMVSVSQELLDRKDVNAIGKLPRKFARSAATTLEVKVATVFNNAFTTTLADAKALCATDHPLLAPGAGTSSNRLAVDADLSISSIKDMIALFNGQLDTAGNKLNIQPKFLLVPGALQFDAQEILKSQFLPGGSNNNINSVASLYSIEPIVWQFLTDSDAFFMLSDKDEHELHLLWDKKFAVASAVDFKTDSALTRGLMRFAYGASNWRGVCGTSGSG